MTRRRYAIAMTVVMSAALCADRAAAAPHQQGRPQSASVASRVMQRLSSSLRRAVPAAQVLEMRREGAAVRPILAMPQRVIVAQQPLSPFQFRLPPPIA